ncbi:MAG TPA: STAS domain-containing protein [Acidimicrobiales bacterium]|nr:STAS domain-containing protein [Acidimicrobiales bacterium]
MTDVRHQTGFPPNEGPAAELLRTELVAGDPPVLRVAGEIDLSTADQLRTALEEALSAGPDVVIDMAAVTFFDASGLRVVLQVAESLNGQGPLTLFNARRVARVLALVGLTDLPSIVVREKGDALGR